MMIDIGHLAEPMKLLVDAFGLSDKFEFFPLNDFSSHSLLMLGELFLRVNLLVDPCPTGKSFC